MITFEELERELGFDQVFISSAVRELERQGLVEVKVEKYNEISLGKKARELNEIS